MAPYIIDIFESNKSVHEVHNKHRELTLLLLVTKYVVQYSSSNIFQIAIPIFFQGLENVQYMQLNNIA